MFIHDYVVKFAVVRHFFTGICQSLFDNLFGILPAIAHASFQRVFRWRQNENADGIGKLFPDLAGALPIDFQQNIFTGGQLRLDRLLGRTFVIAVYQGVLEEIAVAYHRLEFFLVDEMVMLCVSFTRTRLARGKRDRQDDSRFRERVAQKVSRGKIDLSFRYRPSVGHVTDLKVNERLLEQLAQLSFRIADKFPEPRTEITELLRFPGVLEEAPLDQAGLQSEAMALLDLTLIEFVVSRGREGEKLAAVMQEKINGIERIVSHSKKS